MKRMAVALVLMFIAVSFAQTKREKIITLLDLMGSEESVEVMKTEFGKAIKVASPTAPTPLLDSLFERLDKEGLYELTIPIYDKHLDEKTIDGLIAFYKTEAGQAFVEKMPSIMQESMQAGAAWGQQLVLEILSEIKERGYEVEGI